MICTLCIDVENVTSLLTWVLCSVCRGIGLVMWNGQQANVLFIAMMLRSPSVLICCPPATTDDTAAPNATSTCFHRGALVGWYCTAFLVSGHKEVLELRDPWGSSEMPLCDAM